MKIFIMLLFSCQIASAQYKLSDLFGDSRKDGIDYPIYVESDNLWLLTTPQVETIVTFLEDRIHLKKVIAERTDERDYSDLMVRQMRQTLTFDSKLINTLTDVIELKESESIVILKGVDYKVNKIDLFLTKERDELLKKNSRLKKTVWTTTAIAIIGGAILLIN